MKRIFVLLGLMLITSVYAITFVDEKNYADEIVGDPHLKGAKFVGDTIWEDEPINAKRDYITYYQAKKYCSDLKLLGIKRWQLPSKIDFKVLDTDMYRLRYRAFAPRYFSWYFTRDEYNDEKVYVVDISTNKTPYITTTKMNGKNSVRCVLNPNVYNKFRLKQAKMVASNGKLEDYIKAFLLSGKKEYIKKALKLAKNRKEKAKIEAALFKYLGFFKVFDLVKNGEVISNKEDNFDTNSAILAAMEKSKDLKYRFKIVPKRNSPLKLRYNSYKIVFDFVLGLKYNVVTMGVGLSQKKTLYVKKEVVLSPANGYKADFVVDFGKVKQAAKARLFIINQSKKLKNIVLRFSVEDIKVQYK